MGVSTDAILFYGYCWDEEHDLFPDLDDDDRWSNVILARRGVKSPWLDLPRFDLPTGERNKKVDQWVMEHRKEIDEFHRQEKAIKEEFGVEVGYHCSAEYPFPYVYVKAIEARRGYPEKVDPSELSALPGWDEKLDRFLAEFNIEKPNEKPRWWLVSYWG